MTDTIGLIPGRGTYPPRALGSGVLPGSTEEAGTGASARSKSKKEKEAVDLPSSLESPEDNAEREELRRAIVSGLAALPEERRLAILLVDVQGMSYEEAAQVMDCSLGTVKSRISRGRGELRDILRGTGELLPSRFRQDK